MTKPIDITQHVYGRLTVLKRVVSDSRNRWECRCSCGNKVTVAVKELRNGDTKSCGCIRKTQLIARNTTHGLTHTHTYRKWQGMHRRIKDTHNPRNKCYIGVTICKRWAKFENFYKDMGEAPIGYSLERRSNSRGYSPSNCHWVPLEQQAANTSRNRVITFNGVTAHISEHARLQGLRPDVVFDRINKLGWDTHRALTQPLQQQKRK
jgi:hypothetical protein